MKEKEKNSELKNDSVNNEQAPERVEKIKNFKLELDDDGNSKSEKENTQETVKISESVIALVEENNEEDFAQYFNEIQKGKAVKKEQKSNKEEKSSKTDAFSKYKNPKKKKNKKSVFLGCTLNFIYIVIVAAISLALGAYILICANDAFALIKNDETAIIEITKEDDISTIAEKLKEAKIIQEPFAFKMFAKVTKKDEDFKPGKYSVKSIVGYDQIITALKTDMSDRGTVSVVFPEGWNLERMVDELDEKGVCERGKLMAAIQDADFDYPLITEMKQNPDRHYRLEGYLFPDTYEFYLDSGEKDVLSKFLNNMETKITSEMRARAAELNMTMDEILALASIIQHESNSAEVMFTVSGVFHNRLQNGSEYPRLQSDVTMDYYTQKYNTYEIDGLPPGPICNPGLDAIKAALNPEEHDYYFFVTDKNEKYYWAKTYNDHLINCAEVKTIGMAGGINTAGEE